MGYSDEEYVNGIKDGTISKDSFIDDSRGFGIAQWTYWSRKEKLYDYCGPEHIDDLGYQLEFLYNEMGNSLKNDLTYATDPVTATITFEEKFEQAGVPNMSNRQGYASGFYNDYTGMWY